MKALACTVLLLALQLAGAPANAAGAAAGDDIESTLQALEKQRASAILRRDTASLRKLMDRYYRHVESRGRVRSKTELLTALERDEFRFQLYENESTEIQVLEGGKAAVVAGVFRSQMEGRKLFRGRYVRVWVRKADGWKNTFHQGTEIRPATDGCDCK